MTTLTAPEDACTDAASSPAARGCACDGPAGPNRRSSVVDGKCTIGSSPRCQVCLPAAEAKPLQCLVSLEAGVGDGDAVDGRASCSTGASFRRQPLNRGDRLSIGPWELSGSRRAPSREPIAPRRRGVEPAERAVTSTPPPPTRVGDPAQTTADARVTNGADAVELARAIDGAAGMNSTDRPAAAPRSRKIAAPVAASRGQDDAGRRVGDRPFAELLVPARRSQSASAARSRLVRIARARCSQDRLVVSLWSRPICRATRGRGAGRGRSRLATRIAELTGRRVDGTASRLSTPRPLRRGRSAAHELQSIVGWRRPRADTDQLAAELDAMRTPETARPIRACRRWRTPRAAERERELRQLARQSERAATLRCRPSRGGESRPVGSSQQASHERLTRRSESAPLDPRLQTLADAATPHSAKLVDLRAAA